MSDIAHVELSFIPCSASDKGVWALQHARKMGYDDETTVNLIYSEMLLAASCGGWMPIETAPRDKSPMIVVCGVFADRHYVTDPWCVFWQEGAWQRWPHKDPPTHWMPLPERPRLIEPPIPYRITEAGRAMLRDAQQSSPDRQQGE